MNVGVLIIKSKLGIRKTDDFNLLLFSLIKYTNDHFIMCITELYIHESRTIAAAGRKA